MIFLGFPLFVPSLSTIKKKKKQHLPKDKTKQKKRQKNGGGEKERWDKQREPKKNHIAIISSTYRQYWHFHHAGKERYKTSRG